MYMYMCVYRGYAILVLLLSLSPSSLFCSLSPSICPLPAFPIPSPAFLPSLLSLLPFSPPYLPSLLSLPLLSSPPLSPPSSPSFSETFSFVLTNMEGQRRFGYCRRLLVSHTYTVYHVPHTIHTYMYIHTYRIYVYVDIHLNVLVRWSAIYMYMYTFKQ